MDDRLMATALQAIAGLDLDSADGRAGVMSMLRQIEEQAPGSVEQLAAGLQLRRAGVRTATAH